MKYWTLLFSLLAAPAWGDSTLSIGPDGVRLNAQGRGIGVKVEGGTAELNVSATGLLTGASVGPSLPSAATTTVVSPPSAPSFTDSQSFFEAVGKAYPVEAPIRRRPRVNPPE